MQKLLPVPPCQVQPQPSPVLATPHIACGILLTICTAAPPVFLRLSLSFFAVYFSGSVCQPLLKLDVLSVLRNMTKQPLPGSARPILLLLCSLCSLCRCPPLLAGRLPPPTCSRVPLFQNLNPTTATMGRKRRQESDQPREAPAQPLPSARFF